VGAIFDGKKGKRVEAAPAEGSKPKESSKKQKHGKNGKKNLGKRPMERDEGPEEINAVDPSNKGARGPPRGGVFDDMLKKPYTYHKTPVAHTLEQCDMLKKYYSCVAAKEDNIKKDGGDGGKDGFSEVENVFLIFGGPTVDMMSRQRMRECREVYSVHPAVPSYLGWSEETISFGREDHPDHIPNSRQYPLVVDRIISNTRFCKVLMDGGSSLNVMYSSTLELMVIGLDKLRPSKSPFHGVAPDKRVQLLG
jgi:hypothetical protein